MSKTMEKTKDLYSKLAERRLDAKVKLFDAQGIAVETHELEALEQTLYETIFTPTEAFQFVPISSEFNPAISSIAYTIRTRTGVAETMNRNSDVRPEAGGFREKFSAAVQEAGAAYSYSVDNADMARLTGFDEALEDAKACADMIREWHDKVAVDGYDLGVTGFVNDANVAVSQAKQTWTAGVTTGDTMFRDVAQVINDIPEDSDGAHSASDLVMPINIWNRLSTERFDTTSAFTVLEKLRTNYPSVNFSQWSTLKDKAAAGGDPRFIAYQRNADYAVYRATVVYDESPPQMKGFKFHVDARGRAAGVVVRYPLSMKYQDITLA